MNYETVAKYLAIFAYQIEDMYIYIFDPMTRSVNQYIILHAY